MKAAFKPGIVFLTFANKMSPTENLLFSISLFNSINLPSLSNAKSTAEESDLTISSLFTLINFYVVVTTTD